MIKLENMVIMVLVIGLLIAPSARHRLVYKGEASADIDRFITGMSAFTLVPFVLALALDVGLAGGLGGVGLACALALRSLTSLLCFRTPPALETAEREDDDI